MVKVHVCEGTCGAVVSEEEFQGGLGRCGTSGCTREGQSFTDKMKCDECGKIFAVNETHTHI